MSGDEGELIAPTGSTLPSTAVHKGAGHVCPTCGRRFGKANHLNRHLATHLDYRPYSCTRCSKAFARTDALQRHERKVHAVQRPTKGQSAAADETAEQAPDTPNASSSASVSSIPPLLDLQQPDALLGLGSETPTDNSLARFLDTLPGTWNNADLNVDNFVNSWLQEGGPTTGENALALAFSTHATPSPDDSNFFNTGQYSSFFDSNVDLPPAPAPAPAPVMVLQPPLPAPHVSMYQASPSVQPAASLDVDTWQTEGHKEEAMGGMDGEGQLITSPDQVMDGLHIEEREETAAIDRRFIPSMTFLDTCVHLYFRDFHPSFPILHKATFSRHTATPLLLLSICSIGSMFVGTQAAREKGLWIYAKLHYVIVFGRDKKMSTQKARISVTLSGFLGQCFSFLYGKSKQMLTAEGFHGCLITFARRTGLCTLAKTNTVPLHDLASLDSTSLEVYWRIWAETESLRRVCFGLTMHAAESTAYSSMPRLLPSQFKEDDGFSDILFFAEDANTWRDLILQYREKKEEIYPSAFCASTLLAQKSVNICQLRELAVTESSIGRTLSHLPTFYEEMLGMADRHGILSPTSPLGDHDVVKVRILWHYCCIARLTALDDIERLIGRKGSPSPDMVNRFREWTATSEARLAILHAGHLLKEAINTKDLAFLVPRAIFQAVLLLYCFLTHEQQAVQSVLKLGPISNWMQLAQCAAAADFVPTLDGDGDAVYQSYVRNGQAGLALEGFLDGKDRQMDLISLLSTSTRLLRRCTPWGLGGVLANILAGLIT